MTCLLKSKIQKIFLILRIFFFSLKHEAACIVQHSVYNRAGNAHTNELDEKYRAPPADPWCTDHRCERRVHWGDECIALHHTVQVRLAYSKAGSRGWLKFMGVWKGKVGGA